MSSSHSASEQKMWNLVHFSTRLMAVKSHSCCWVMSCVQHRISYPHILLPLDPLTLTAAICVELQSILCLTGLSWSFVIFDNWALWRSALNIRVPGCQNYKWWLNPDWHRMLYSCVHVAAVSVKGLNFTTLQVNLASIFRISNLRNRTVVIAIDWISSIKLLNISA